VVWRCFGGLFGCVVVFCSSFFRAFSRILWDRAFLKDSSSGVVVLGL